MVRKMERARVDITKSIDFYHEINQGGVAFMGGGLEEPKPGQL